MRCRLNPAAPGAHLQVAVSENTQTLLHVFTDTTAGAVVQCWTALRPSLMAQWPSLMALARALPQTALRCYCA